MDVGFEFHWIDLVQRNGLFSSTLFPEPDVGRDARANCAASLALPGQASWITILSFVRQTFLFACLVWRLAKSPAKCRSRDG